MADKMLSAYSKFTRAVAVALLRNCYTCLLPNYIHLRLNHKCMIEVIIEACFIMLVPFRRESGNDPSGLAHTCMIILLPFH